MWLSLGGVFLGLGPGAGPGAAAELPPALARSVDFGREVRPLLEASCGQCHGRGKSKGGFRIDTRETFLKGGESGAAAVSGRSGESLAVKLVAGLDEDSVMPQKGKRWTAEQVSLLRAWIDQGLPWDPAVSLGRREPSNLRPRASSFPSAAPGLGQPIDRWVGAYFRERSIEWPQVVDDRTYARRVWLDTVGLTPPPAELRGFLADQRADKRERLVSRLLSEGIPYAEHWMSFWNDALRNDYRGTGYIDGGRRQITSWLFGALATNMPFDRFVAALVNPVEETEGFTKGIVWRGVVNASQVPPMQAAQNIAQVFLGTNLKCASCHDSFVNDWSLSDAYGLASVYAEQPLEMHECDKPTGRTSQPSFIFPELGGLDGATTRGQRMERLAAILTSRENGRLTRTLVNRLWGRLMGRALVEPVDDMERRAWSPEVLDWLAEDLADHGYDVKRTLATILTSRAYQLPAVGATEQTEESYVFRGPTVRRLTAEQFRDALGMVTGVWFGMPQGELVNFWAGLPEDERESSLAREGLAQARWVWNTPDASGDGGDVTVFFRREFQLETVPERAWVVSTADSKHTVYLNGRRVGSGSAVRRPMLEPVQANLVAGTNVLAVMAINDPVERRKDEAGVEGRLANPGGLLVYLQFSGSNAPPRGLATGREWVCTTNKTEGWEKPAFETAGWKGAFELGPVGMAPWTVGERFMAALSTVAKKDRVRSALVAADPLTTALGRPNREQAMTSRYSAATTLQALELANGEVLDKVLKRGAERLLAEGSVSAEGLVRTVFERAVGRSPGPVERAAGLELLGSAPTAEGVQDLVWAVAMLPEFQLIQ